MNLFELSVLQRLHEALSSPLLDRLSVLISAPVDHGLGVILLAALLLCFRRTRRLGAVLTTALALDFLLINLCLKPLLMRARPYDLGVSFPLLAKPPGDYSFPSGHTAAAFAAATAMLARSRKAFAAMLVYAVLVGLSRMYLMMHYPSDVLAGAVLGALCGLLAVGLWNRLSKKKGAGR